MQYSLFRFRRLSAPHLIFLSLYCLAHAARVFGATFTIDTMAVRELPATEDVYLYGELMFPGSPAVTNYARGEYSDDGDHATMGVTFAGKSGEEFDEFYRAYFGFDLRALAGATIGSAVLRLELQDYAGANAFEDFTIHDASIRPGDVLLSPEELDPAGVYEDLGSTFGGDILGVGRFYQTDVEGTTIDIVLSAQAVALINSAIANPVADDRFFGVGASLTEITENTPAGYEEGIRFAAGNEYRKHQLILTTVPDGGATILLLAFGGLCLSVLRLRRR